MSGSDWLLLLKFIIEGVGFIKTFIRDQEVRDAFSQLKDSKTDLEKQAVAQKMASLIYTR